jgi:hypothetical protein
MAFSNNVIAGRRHSVTLERMGRDPVLVLRPLLTLP